MLFRLPILPLTTLLVHNCAFDLHLMLEIAQLRLLCPKSLWDLILVAQLPSSVLYHANPSAEATEEATKYQKGRAKISLASVEPMGGLASKSARVKPVSAKEMIISNATLSQEGRGRAAQDVQNDGMGRAIYILVQLSSADVWQIKLCWSHMRLRIAWQS